ncbi:hypothetical protein J0A67_04230 [Algoriphagus aestuariicola]|uniref:Uncharacterized protein n=1 Tax=Algoriphagus aestuariicola TaxID=1852016 RepID=A0ABS3BQV2_9BACT|nr:hypothetical protein [Algoriphagus aestuariicola]MBN7800054.1 hypothetical protein [Algoriphagus aestuariicola]
METQGKVIAYEVAEIALGYSVKVKGIQQPRVFVSIVGLLLIGCHLKLSRL